MASIKFAQMNIEPQFIMSTFKDEGREKLNELLASMNILPTDKTNF